MAHFDIASVGLRTRVTCPFNPAHVMNFSKYHSHFIKCQKNHPNDVRKPCPYNFSELIHPDKLADHMEYCPYKSDYGTKKKDVFNGEPRITAPYDIDFGSDDERSSKRPGDFQDYQCDGTSDGEANDLDSEIDSVSVIGERRLLSERGLAGPNSAAAGSSFSAAGSSSNFAGLPSTVSMNLGRGRAAYFMRRRAQSSLSGSRVEPPPIQDQESDESFPESDKSFSFLREANIRPDSTKSRASSVSSSSVVNKERLAHLRMIQDKIERDYPEEEKPRGRGRGVIFGRS